MNAFQFAPYFIVVLLKSMDEIVDQETGDYTPCQMPLIAFDNIPKLKSTVSRPHDVAIQTEELEAIQLALEDQLSWLVNQNSFERGTVVKRFEIGLLNKRSGVRIP